jgi:hypothetical protein
VSLRFSKALIRGLISFVPILRGFVLRKRPGCRPPEYFYSAWMRHLVSLHSVTGKSSFSKVAELGPGANLGMGICAILSGSQRYYALDVEAFADIQENLKLLDCLLELFRQRAPIPDDGMFPKLKPKLENYSFPENLFKEEFLEKLLAEERVERLRKMILSLHGPVEDTGQEPFFRYKAPWISEKGNGPQDLNLVFSQAVMEHVDQAEKCYGRMADFLGSEGLMSHQIDFKSHGTAEQWNGHWAYRNLTWRIISGTKPYSLNRLSHSKHQRFLRDHGFDILHEQLARDLNGISRDALAPQFRDYSDKDLETSGAYILSQKSSSAS